VKGLVRPELARQHFTACRDALDDLEAKQQTLVDWAGSLLDVYVLGGRLLVAGNGGSAALAEHLAAELVGRYCVERPAFSAISLASDCSAGTATGNDYGFEQVFARSVQAHGRAGDILLLLSTSGRSPNLLAAAAAARRAGLRTWALTGPAPNALVACCDESLAVDGSTGASVQEAQQVAVHLLCASFDALLGSDR
jgi:D-sedoheptulose 7-phosphate isomerase